MAESKIDKVREMFGVKHAEWFEVERDGVRYECRFLGCGLRVKQDENPYVKFDIGANLLQDLLTGRAKIVE